MDTRATKGVNPIILPTMTMINPHKMMMICNITVDTTTIIMNTTPTITIDPTPGTFLPGSIKSQGKTTSAKYKTALPSS